MEITNIDKDISILGSTYNYDRINNWYKSYGDTAICNSMEESLSNYQGIKDFCIQLTGVLKKFNNLSFTGPFANDPCTIINYWMYDYLFNRIIKQDGSKDITTILAKLYSFWENLISLSTCDIKSYLGVQNNFNDLKHLYDYATNYENIKLYLTEKSLMCTENIKKYLDQIHEIYKRAQQKCASSHDYCTVLEYIHKKYNTEKVLDLKCIVTLSSELTPGQGKNGERMDAHTRGQHVEMEVQHDPYSTGMPKSDTPSTSASNIIMASAFPIFGVILIFFILYKFTPIGTLLQSKLNKGKGKMKFMNEESYNFLTHPSETELIYSEVPHHIAYHSI
ncbi:PIR Superfamily Protein [Plasmodium ovale curtisi]|uniref:PIR Superfamily Protein n=1 Tax=Plasmodium ovale curtisi TaxID=864141 RepID=A0A1A8WHZ9_PLAOA|nr:PIR Superfamily Protein [Plasmodium ovale curtisi]